MEVRFIARKCTQCAGRLQYDSEKKLWKCLYCGAEIERQEQYDGLYTIKNVVRQALLDTAFHRLDSAQKNIVECEKIDARYVGTIITKIAYEMISITTPNACTEGDNRNLFAQLKRNCALLAGTGVTVSDEEEALYDFLEEADIYAMLILVYDSIGDAVRRDYVTQMLVPAQVYARDTNDNLLHYAIKNENFSLADAILQNTDNLHADAALAEVLCRYPDGETKRVHADKLFQACKTSGETFSLEEYLSVKTDSDDTRAAVILSAVRNGSAPRLSFVMESVLPEMEADNACTILRVYCEKKLADAEILQILTYVCSREIAGEALAILGLLAQSGQYVFISAKTGVAMLSVRTWSVSDKAAVLDRLLSFAAENKWLETVVSNYLCFQEDPVEVRSAFLPYLLEKLPVLPTSAVQNYILYCTIDGEGKPDIVRAIFQKGINTSFYSDLFSRYIHSTADSDAVRAEIMGILSDGGLRLDPNAFMDYICQLRDNLPDTMQFVQKTLEHGVPQVSAYADIYLERIAPAQFQPELFTLLLAHSSVFHAGAVERYLLYCKDRESVKAGHFRILADGYVGELGGMSCHIRHMGNSVICNLLQAYVLLSVDTQSVTYDIVDWLISKQKIKLSAEMTVNGKGMRFRRYVISNRAQLSDVTNDICTRYRVYTMLFLT